MSAEFDCIKITTPQEQHETFIRFGESVSVRRCLDKDCSCGAQFHCPFCDPKYFKENNAFSVQEHLEQFHWPAGVQYKDVFIVQCLLRCGDKHQAHYHCPVCTDYVELREEFVTHLQAHLVDQKESVRLAYAPDTKQPEHLVYEDYTLTLCGKDCSIMFSGMKHYHCPGCGELRWNAATTASHLSECPVLNKHRPHFLFSASKQRALKDPRIQFAKHWHESMVRDNYDITVRRCTAKCCGKQYHCPLCTVKTKPCMVAPLRKHFSYHLDYAVKHKGYLLLACCLDCDKPGQSNAQTHYHCPYCGKTVPDRVEFTYHLRACAGSTDVEKDDSDDGDEDILPFVNINVDNSNEGFFKFCSKIGRPKQHQQQMEMFESVFATLSQSFLRVFTKDSAETLEDILMEVAGAAHVEVCSSPGTDPRRPGFALKGRLQNILKTESLLHEKFDEVNQDKTIKLKTCYIQVPERPVQTSVSVQTCPLLETVPVKPVPSSPPALHLSQQQKTIVCPPESCKTVTDHDYSKDAGIQRKLLNMDELFHVAKTKNVVQRSQAAHVGMSDSLSIVHGHGNSGTPTKMTLSEAVKTLSGLAKLVPSGGGFLGSEAQGVRQTFIIPSQEAPQNAQSDVSGTGVHLLQLSAATSVQLEKSAKPMEGSVAQSGMNSGIVTFITPQRATNSEISGFVLPTGTSKSKTRQANMTHLPGSSGSKRSAESTAGAQEKHGDLTAPKRLCTAGNVQNGQILPKQASQGLKVPQGTHVSTTVLTSNNSVGIAKPPFPPNSTGLSTTDFPKTNSAEGKPVLQIRNTSVEDQCNITTLIPIQVVPSAKEGSEMSRSFKYVGVQATQNSQMSYPVKQQPSQTSDFSSKCVQPNVVTVMTTSSNDLNRSEKIMNAASSKQPVVMSTERRLTRSQIVNSYAGKNQSVAWTENTTSCIPIQSASENQEKPPITVSIVNVKHSTENSSPVVFPSDQASSSESPRRYSTRSLKLSIRSPVHPKKSTIAENDQHTPSILKGGSTSVTTSVKGNSVLAKQNAKLAALLNSDSSVDSESTSKAFKKTMEKSTSHDQSDSSEYSATVVRGQSIQNVSSDEKHELELTDLDLPGEIPTVRFHLNDVQSAVVQNSSQSWTKVQGRIPINKSPSRVRLASSNVSEVTSKPGTTMTESPKRYFTRGRKVDTSVLKGRGKPKDMADVKKTSETAISKRILRSSPWKARKGLVSLPSSKHSELPRTKRSKSETPAKATNLKTVNKKNKLLCSSDINTSNTRRSDTITHSVDKSSANTSSTSQGKKNSDQEVSTQVTPSEDLAPPRKIPTVRFQLNPELGSASRSWEWTVIEGTVKMPEEVSDNISVGKMVKKSVAKGGSESGYGTVLKTPVVTPPAVSRTQTQTGMVPAVPESMGTQVLGLLPLNSNGEVPIQKSAVLVHFSGASSQPAPSTPVICLPINPPEPSQQLGVRTRLLSKGIELADGSMHKRKACPQSSADQNNHKSSVQSKDSVSNTKISALFSPTQSPSSKPLAVISENPPEQSQPLDVISEVNSPTLVSQDSQVSIRSIFNPKDQSQNSASRNDLLASSSQKTVSNTSISTFFIPAQPVPSEPVVSSSCNPMPPSQPLDVTSSVALPELASQDAQVSDQSIIFNPSIRSQNSEKQNKPEINPSGTSISTLLVPSQPGSSSTQDASISENALTTSQALDIASKVTQPQLASQVAQVLIRSIHNPDNIAHQKNPKVSPSRDNVSSVNIFHPAQAAPSTSHASISENLPAPRQQLNATSKVTTHKLVSKDAQASPRSLLDRNFSPQTSEKHKNLNDVLDTSMSTSFRSTLPSSGWISSIQIPATKDTSAVNDRSQLVPTNRVDPNVFKLNTSSATCVKAQPALKLPEFLKKQSCYLPNIQTGLHTGELMLQRTIKRSKTKHVEFAFPNPKNVNKSTIAAQTELKKSVLEKIPVPSTELPYEPYSDSTPILNEVETLKAVKGMDAMKLTEKDESIVIERNESSYCPICRRNFEKRGSLPAHIMASHFKYRCQNCLSVFTKKDIYVEHLKSVHKDKDGSRTLLGSPNPCGDCNMGFTTRSDLDSHQRKFHNFAVCCSICAMTFSAVSALRVHIMTYHLSDGPSVCDVCGKSFRLASYLANHRKRHFSERNQVCPVCGKRFKENYSLKEHMDIHKAPGERKYRYMCSYCGKGFNCKPIFRDHINCHTGEKPHKCPTCGKTFCRLSTMKKHELIHSDKRPFACEFCIKAFKSKAALQTHIVTHTGVSKHKCNFCRRAFGNSNISRTHMVRCEKNPNRIPVPVNTRRKQRDPEEKAIVARALENLKNINGQAVEVMSEVSELTVESDDLSSDTFVYMCTACNKEFDDVLTAGSHIEHCTSWK